MSQVGFLLFLFSMLIVAVIGFAGLRLERREREERLAAEALDTSRLLDESLNERLHEIDTYRHSLAALLQELDLEQVRAADEGRRSN